MQIGFQAHRIVMLYSVDNCDMGVVRRLQEHVESLTTESGKIGYEAHEILNLADLRKVLLNISIAVPIQGYPLIHLDMHGDAENGLLLLSGEWMKWEELADCLGKINLLTKNRLAVISAVCFGIKVINPANIDKPAPFKCIFASEERVSNADVEDILGKFYTVLIAEENLEKAIALLTPKFQEFRPEQYLFNSLKEILVRYKGRKGSKIREDATTAVRAELPVDTSLDLPRIRRALKDYDKDFDDKKMREFTNIYLCGETPFFQLQI